MIIQDHKEKNNSPEKHFHNINWSDFFASVDFIVRLATFLPHCLKTQRRITVTVGEDGKVGVLRHSLQDPNDLQGNYCV